MSHPPDRGLAAPFVVADIGSTTTKAILFSQDPDGRIGFLRREAPTTVEEPHEDVAVGLLAAIRALAKESELELLRDDLPAVPLLLTSSAGGGLAMVVIGLVRRVTSLSAERAALGAGAILLDTIALDDGRVPYQKVMAMTDLRPDMLLFAGGFDGEAIGGPVLLAELVRQADLRPKLNPDARLPVVYAGNVYAKELVEETLADRYLLHPVENIRPESDIENLEPARHAIHDLFMQHVMSHAPGYAALESWVRAPILPTPAALSAILSILSAERDERILAIDIGGATTDVFTAEKGEVFRTVSANLGMSYSAINVANLAGPGGVARHLDVEMTETELLDRIGNKYLAPTTLPATETDRKVEWAVATAAVRLAVKEHLDVLSGAPISRGKGELSIRGLRHRKEESAEPREEPPLTLGGYDLVIGSGGVLSHSPREATARILLRALQPVGVVRLAADRAFMLPHLGVLSGVDPALAAELARTLGMVPLGTVVAGRASKPGRGRIRVEGETGDGRQVEAAAPAGGATVVPLGAGESARLAVSGQGMKGLPKEAYTEGGVLGLVLDARGRPAVGDEPSLPVPGPSAAPARATVSADSRVRTGTIRRRRELAIPGPVLVEPGDRLEADALVARCVRTFPRPFFLRANVALGVPLHEVPEHLVKEVGEEIERDEILARRDRGIISDKIFRAGVSGTIERILSDGTIVIREKLESAGGAHAIEAAEDLGVRPGQLPPHLRVEIGQEVEPGQAVAQMITGAGVRASISPVRGRVKSIDGGSGIVLIEPVLMDLEVRAFLPGVVEEVTPRGAVVALRGTRIRGAWGHGGEASGPLSVGTARAGHVVVMREASAAALTQLETVGAAALVTGGLSLQEVLDAAPAFPVILTEGFGRRRMDREIHDALAGHVGRMALVDGTTKLRVGVQRPVVLLPETGLV